MFINRSAETTGIFSTIIKAARLLFGKQSVKLQVVPNEFTRVTEKFDVVRSTWGHNRF